MLDLRAVAACDPAAPDCSDVVKDGTCTDEKQYKPEEPAEGQGLISTIKNNILTIEKIKMRIAGFRPRLEGQCSLDGQLNLKGRIGLPPFGIFGIPFTVKGTQDNPIVKLKRDKDGKPLQVKDEKETEEGAEQQ